jgi:hypothetical protein
MERMISSELTAATVLVDRVTGRRIPVEMALKAAEQRVDFFRRWALRREADYQRLWRLLQQLRTVRSS